jgi:chorismate synthase
MIRFLTAGESHGKSLMGILEGFPAGLDLSADDINIQLSRRQKGYGRGGRMKIEKDQVDIISGVRYGKTTGAPIGLIIPNLDWENWGNKVGVEPIENPSEPLTSPRPGHADLAGVLKFGHDDIRNVIERASARDTAMQVAIGAVCRKLLQHFGIEIISRVVRIGNIRSTIKHSGFLIYSNEMVDKSPIRCLDISAEKKIIKLIDKCKSVGDTLGGEFEIMVDNLPAGFGSYVHADLRLDGILCGALTGIPAIKSVEVGSAGDTAIAGKGSSFHDSIFPSYKKLFRRETNHAGGIEGGVSNGSPVILYAAMKPLASLTQPMESIDLATGKAIKALKERSDVCAVPAASIVGENIIAIAITKLFLQKLGGDSLKEIEAHYNSWGDKWHTCSSPE